MQLLTGKLSFTNTKSRQPHDDDDDGDNDNYDKDFPFLMHTGAVCRFADIFMPLLRWTTVSERLIGGEKDNFAAQCSFESSRLESIALWHGVVDSFL